MAEFITQYWIEFFFGLVAACMIWTIRKYYKLSNEVKTQHEEDLKEEIENAVYKEIAKVEEQSKSENGEVKQEIVALTGSVERLTVGLLSIQGKAFRQECKEMLEDGRIITVDEYDQFEEDYSAYKGLNGNHIGDALHDRVVDKFNKQIAANSNTNN